MAPNEVFLASGESNEATVGARIYEIVTVSPPLDASVLSRGLAILDHQFVTEIPPKR